MPKPNATNALKIVYSIDNELSDCLNFLKFVLILLIVYLHSYNLTSGESYSSSLKFLEVSISQVIARVAVPFFFFISSFLLYAKEFHWKTNIQKKSRTLLLPLLIWNSLWIALYFFTSIIFSFDFIPQYHFGEFGISDWINLYFLTPVVSPLWFLKDLFLLNLLAIPMKAAVDRFPYVAAIALIVLWNFSFQISWLLELRSSSIFYFMLGYFAVKYKFSFENVKKIRWREIIPTYLTLVVVAATLYGQSEFHIIQRISILAGGVFLMKTSYCVIKSPFINRFKILFPYSFFIFLFHEKTMTIIRKIIEKILPASEGSLCFEYLMIPPFVVVLALLIGICLKKNVPSLYKLLTGSR